MQLLVDTGGSCLQTPGEAMNALSQCESHIAISWSVINRRLGTFLVSNANGNEKRICKPSFKINFEAACVRIVDKFSCLLKPHVLSLPHRLREWLIAILLSEGVKFWIKSWSN